MVSKEFAIPAEMPGLISLLSPSRLQTAPETGVLAGSELPVFFDVAGRDKEIAQLPTTVKSGPATREMHSGGQFVLGQNFPNPYTATTTVPFSLVNPSDVMLEVFDVLGRKIFSVVRKAMEAGEHAIDLNLLGLGTSSGNYLYQLKVTNKRGTFRQSKIMTAAL
jgi:hypothetical protein